MKKILLIWILIVGIVIVGVYSFSFLKKGKYLSKVDFQLLELPYDSTLVACLGINITNESDYKYREIVINTEGEYQDFIDEVHNGFHESCKNLEFPEIDFQNNTLIGALASHWCRAYFERDVRIDNTQKIYRYIIQEKLNCVPIVGCVVRDCIPRHTLNLTTIPRVEDDYHVAFEVYKSPWR